MEELAQRLLMQSREEMQSRGGTGISWSSNQFGFVGGMFPLPADEPKGCPPLIKLLGNRSPDNYRALIFYSLFSQEIWYGVVYIIL